MSRNRKLIAVVCLVVVVATALAPLGGGAFCTGLVVLPALFANVRAARVPDAPAPRVSSVLDSSPLALRAPPAA